MNLCDALNFVKVFEESGEENFHLFVSQVETTLSFIGKKNESDLVRAICNTKLNKKIAYEILGEHFKVKFKFYNFTSEK